jgi:site-specific recombinase XerD
MTLLGQHLAAFLREHLPRDRGASPHTCEAYATCFQLLVVFAASHLRTKPSDLTVEEIDATLVLAFLDHLATARGNGTRSRNARLAAINAFFRVLEYRLPDCLDQAGRIHAIQMKKVDEALVTHLTRVEIKALLDAPDPRTPSGTRDRAMIHLAFAAGLRVSELIGSTNGTGVISA